MATFDFSTTNKPNYKNKGDYGVRVARPGYDAINCAENQLVFNSNWPILQITAVVDLNKPVDSEVIWHSWTNGTWQTNTPSNIAKTGDGTPIEEVFMGRNFVYKELALEIYVDDNTSEVWNKITYKRFRHGLGFQPLFFMSENISNITGYVVLTSVDLTVDVDYPYTEEPTQFYGSMEDYGLKSESDFGENVPGLCSNMFSKLVQCVKTEETARQWLGSTPILTWSPLTTLANGYQNCLEPYECYAYNGFGDPFGNGADQVMDDGPYYTRYGIPVRTEPADDSAFVAFGDAVAYTTLGQGGYDNTKASMVVLRSPMVSPEYEEITI